MNLIRNASVPSELRTGVVATIGNFDGVHLGHQALLKALCLKSKQVGLPTVVILFEPQPSEFFNASSAPARLDSLREKMAKLKSHDIDYVYCIRFNKRLSLMPPEVFAKSYLFEQLNIKHIIIGNDFRFGYQRLGDIHLLRRLGTQNDCHVESFSDFAIAGHRVSSTTIRYALKEGQLEKAAELLGRPFSMCGRVIRGEGLGRQWGIPTANINPSRKNLPIKGVYCVQVKRINQTIVNGVANIGIRPTVQGNRPTLEIHLFDFNQTIYGEQLEVVFLRKLRDEMKFPSIDELLVQIKKDMMSAKQFFNQADATSFS